MNTQQVILPFGYTTDEDTDQYRKWALRRNRNADYAASIIDELLQDAVRKLTKVAYKYNCKPEEWKFSQNKELMKEVAEIMDELEDEIFAIMEEYSLNETPTKERHNYLLPLFLALTSKGAKDLRGVLHLRLMQFLYDTEAQIAAMKLAGYNQTKAVTRILSTMNTVYSSPEVNTAYRKRSSAMYLISRGIHENNKGLSSSGAINVSNLARQTAVIMWLKSQLMTFDEKGAVGFYQLRGSDFPCNICDEEEGLHINEDWKNTSYPHAHCQCWRIPVYFNNQTGNIDVNI